MKKFAFGILLVFFFFAPKEAFSLTYGKKKSTTLIGTQKGTTEIEGFFLTGLGNLPVCKILNIDNYTILRQGLKINYDSNLKLHSVEKGLFDCNLSIYDEPLSMIYEGMIEYFQEKHISVYYKHSNGKNYAYDKKSDNIWYHKEFDERYAPDNPKSGHIIRTATANEIQHAERLVVFYNNIDLSSPSAKIYDGIINKDIHINNKVSSEKKFSQPTSQKEISKNKNSITNELEKLEQLLKRGSITKQEYQKAKEKILN